jgi:predicted KAP-like P-loop ATPase
MEKVIENIVEKNLEEISNEKKEIEITVDFKNIYERLISLEKENERLNKVIEYNDANIKANYLLSIIGMLYFIMSYYFDFSQVLKISNLMSTLIVVSLLAVFFFKENTLIVKHLLKKIL